jgi:hypothetical protein
MSFPTKASILALAAAAALVAAPAFAQQAKRAAPVALRGADCFFSRDWRGWKSPSPDVLYVRVRQHDVYRIDLGSGGPRLDSPSMHLVSISRGSDRICAPIDLDLRVSDSIGPPIPLFPRGIVKLTPEQAKALPKEARP